MCGLSTVVTPAGASLTMYREIRSYANSIWDDNNNNHGSSRYPIVRISWYRLRSPYASLPANLERVAETWNRLAPSFWVAIASEFFFLTWRNAYLHVHDLGHIGKLEANLDSFKTALTTATTNGPRRVRLPIPPTWYYLL